ncbi:MAG: acyltransferase [Anaerolineae bacterium]|nr:acyltransferase [Anaerolineae bacterium]
MQPKAQLKALTGIRFFAALAVIAFHLYLAAPEAFPRYVASLASYGFVGVSLFFVLSGFVLAYNYCPSPAGGSKPIDKQKFWVARFARVYPAYVLALLIGLLTYGTIAQPHTPAWTTLRLVLEGTLLHSWFPWTACGINCPGWSVAVEAFFYALFPFIAAFAIKFLGKLTPAKVIVVIVILWALAMIAPSVAMLFVPDFLEVQTYILLFDALIYNPLLNAPQFLMGMCAGMLFVQKRGVAHAQMRQVGAGNASLLGQSRSFGLAWGAGLAALAALMLMPPEVPWFTFLLRLGFLSPIFALLIYALAHGRGVIVKLLSLPPLLLLGEASYGIYILETPLNRLLKLLSEAGWLPAYNSIWYGAAFLLILTTAAIASLYLIEPRRESTSPNVLHTNRNSLHQKFSRGGAE